MKQLDLPVHSHFRRLNVSLLRNRNYSLLLFGQLISTFGDNLYSLALPWFIYSLTGSKSDLALSGVLVYLPAVAGLFVGVLVERWQKRTTMIWSDLIRLVIVIAMFEAARFATHIWLLLALVVILQLVGTIFSPANSALLPIIIGKDDITSASGIRQSGIATTRLLSNLSGGAIMTLFGAAEMFLLDAFTFVASIASLLLLRVKEPATDHTKSTDMFAEWRAGMQYIWRHSDVLRVVITTVLANFALIPTEIVIVAWVKGPMHGQAYVLGITMAAISIGNIVGGVLVKRLTKVMSLRSVLVVGLAATGICVLLIGFDANQLYAMIMLLVVGVAIGVMNGAIGAFYLHSIKPDFRGRTLSTLRALASVAAPIGTSVYGFLMVHLPLSWVFVLLGIPILASGIVMLRSPKVMSQVSFSLQR
jgi:MFS transporter, DHA3 family, macrolide efflux protein